MLYRDNNGKGRYLARVLKINGDRVHLEMWRAFGSFGKKLKKCGRREYFELPYSYWILPACGWREVSE